MLLVKQFRYLNLNGARKLSGKVYQITNLNRFGTILQPVNHLNTTAQLEISIANRYSLIICKLPILFYKIIFLSKFYLNFSDNGLNKSCSNSHNFIGIRHYYRNYEHHPSRIVRAYRQTRTWLTDHFNFADRVFENIYSFTFLVTIIILGIWSAYLNLQVGGETGGLDVDRTQKPNDK